MSMMPPRRENVPGSLTSVTGSYPRSKSHAAVSAHDSRSPARSVRPRRACDGARGLRDEGGPCERSRTGGRVCHRDAPAILKTRRELAVRLAALGKSEDATEAGRRNVDRANH